jgi:hypothetical protein
VLCYDRYITTDRSIPSRSGLYAEDLPGIDADIWDGLKKAAQTEDQLWTMLYEKSWQSIVSDITGYLQDKFFVDSKLVSRETSQFPTSINDTDEPAGVNLKYALPRYSRIHVISATVKTIGDYDQEIIVTIEDKDGNQLWQSDEQMVGPESGYTVFIDQDFDQCELHIRYDPTFIDTYTTEARRYETGLYKWSCNECINDCGGYVGSVEMINGGGLNVIYNVICSTEKFVCENINFFKLAFLYRIGLEVASERKLGYRLNKYTTMTLERADELVTEYTTKYNENLERSMRSHELREDPYCFACKGVVNKRVNI